MRSLAQAFLHPRATARTVLRGETRRHRDHWHAGYRAIVADESEEEAPTGIADPLCQFMLLHQVSYFEVFIGNHVARHDERPCCFAGKVLTLPTDLERAPGKPLDGILPILRTFLFPRNTAM